MENSRSLTHWTNGILPNKTNFNWKPGIKKGEMLSIPNSRNSTCVKLVAWTTQFSKLLLYTFRKGKKKSWGYFGMYRRVYINLCLNWYSNKFVYMTFFWLHQGHCLLHFMGILSSTSINKLLRNSVLQSYNLLWKESDESEVR